MKKQLLVATALILSSSAFTQLTNGLVSQFYFSDGSLQNSVATSSLTLTEDEEPIAYGTDRDGNMTNALVFDGPNGLKQKLSIQNSNLELDLTGDFSISFWFKSDNLTTGAFQVLFSSRQISSSNPGEKGGVDCLINNNGEFEVFFRQANSGAQIDGLTSSKISSISAGVWYHVVVTKAGANVKYYFNSSEASNETITNYPTTNFPSVDYWNVGAFYNTQVDTISRELQGSFDDLRLYNRSLTVQEVTDLYQETPPVLSLNEEEHNSIKLYPNPAHDFITITSNSPVKDIEILSLDGKVVQFVTNTDSIDISTLQKGIYTVKCTLENNQVLKKKLIKE